MRTILLALGLLPSLVWGAALTCPGGLLTPAPLTTAVASANTVIAKASTALAFQAVNTAGTATVEIQMCCVGSCDPATGSWAQVENSPMTLTVSTAVKSVSDPTCQYRAAASACASCSVSVGFACAGP
jgi:hypothetical protein